VARHNRVAVHSRRGHRLAHERTHHGQFLRSRTEENGAAVSCGSTDPPSLPSTGRLGEPQSAGGPPPS
jgi:hypothetical protein